MQDAMAQDAGMDGGGDAGMEDAGMPLLGRGTVRATSTEISATNLQLRATASFREASESGSRCTTDSIGACRVTDCPALQTGPDGGIPDGGTDAGTPDFPHAGQIDITGVGVRSVTLQPDGDGSYPPVSEADLLWNDENQQVEFEAEGGDVPAFSDTMQGPLSVTANVPFNSSDIRIKTDEASTISWQGSAVGSVVASLRWSGSQPGRSVTAVCSFTPSENEGRLPVDALSRFADAVGDTGTLTLEGENRMRKTVQDPGEGRWELALITSASAIIPPDNGGSSRRAVVQVTFE
jgi:hypothetical protein